MNTQQIVTLIRRRYSCRRYRPLPLAAETRQQLADFAASLRRGPLGSRTRFTLIAATDEDRSALRGLGTYGVIRGNTAFIVGAVEQGPHAMEDFGYLMERLVLLATELELGTCWLGGTFTKSRFAARIAAQPDEVVPAVVAVGYAAAGARRDLIRAGVRASRRHPWSRLFFDGDFSTPLERGTAGVYALPLEMVRWGPSASNRQPWRIVRTEAGWHFYLRRTPGYSHRALPFRLLGLADLQRLDIGIAMCHFALTATALGLRGRWVHAEPPLPRPDALTEYIVTWEPSEETT